MQILHRLYWTFLRSLSEINSLVISDVIIENGIYLLQEYFYPLHRLRRSPSPMGRNPARRAVVLLSAAPTHQLNSEL